MYKHISKLAITLLFGMMCSLPAMAQDGTLLNKQFMEFMKAFPGNFSSLFDGEYDPVMGWYYSKVQLEGTKGLRIYSMNNESKNYVEALIDMPDAWTEDQCKKLFSDWEEKLSRLTFNGARLVEYEDPAYADDDWYILAIAWQLDNSADNIASEYLPFTIRLELRDREMGGWELAVVIADESVDVF